MHRCYSADVIIYLFSILVSAKGKGTITKKSSVIYWFQCGRINCENEYIGAHLELLEIGIKNT